ncbi:MAG: phosphotransferase [Solirubrobacteraceae bacterium]
MDRVAAGEWIGLHAERSGAMETVHERPWATVLRVPIGDRVAWLKVCADVQAFEPRLTGELFARWPDRVGEVIAYDEHRRWLLLADAGTPVGVMGNPPEAWLVALPLYAELQRGEVAYVADHLAHGVPDLRLGTLATRYDELLGLDLPLEPEEVRRLQQFASRFAELCDELGTCGVPDTIQHDDLHHGNLYARGSSVRVLDWGDACVGHPFVSLVVTFRFLEERTDLALSDPWFGRLRDAYLEPWGRNLSHSFTLALRVGAFARAIAYTRQRASLSGDQRRLFDHDFSIVLRRAVRRVRD